MFVVYFAVDNPWKLPKSTEMLAPSFPGTNVMRTQYIKGSPKPHLLTHFTTTSQYHLFPSALLVMRASGKATWRTWYLTRIVNTSRLVQRETVKFCRAATFVTRCVTSLKGESFRTRITSCKNFTIDLPAS